MGGLPVNVGDDVLGEDVLVLEVLEEVVDELEPAGVVVDDGAEGVEEEDAFEVLVLCGLEVDAVRAEDGVLVVDLWFVTVDVGEGVGLTPAVLDVEAFEVGGPALVDPHIGGVGGGDGVAEPLVCGLVDDDEVEARAYADAGPVGRDEVAVLEVVAVGDGGLVLHAGVGDLDEFVTIFGKGIWAEVVLVGLQHAAGLGELAFGFVEVFGEGVEVEGKGAEFVGEVLVVANVERDVVVVDGVVDAPVPLRVAVAEVALGDEPAVGDIDEVAGNGDGEVHVLDLVFPLVFVGPPHAGADAFAGGVDPRLTGGVVLEGEDAEATSLDRVAGVEEVDGLRGSGAKGLGEVDEDGVAVAGVLELGGAEEDFVDV